jgi:hypothetical protein
LKRPTLDRLPENAGKRLEILNRLHVGDAAPVVDADVDAGDSRRGCPVRYRPDGSTLEPRGLECRNDEKRYQENHPQRDHG